MVGSFNPEKEQERQNNRERRERGGAPEWQPRTLLGKLVKSGEVTSLEQVYERNLPILESEIIDVLVPNLKEEIINIRTVQRTTDSGRKGSFMVSAAIGNKDGAVGIGTGKGLELRPTIEKAVREAKKNLVQVKRGCGSWECGCSENHSILFKLHGRESSVKIDLLPAPKGTGIVAGATVKKVLELAGVKDAWSLTKGNTKTKLNTAIAAFNALKQSRKTKLDKEN